MLERFDKKARQIQEQTPEDRNRYADFLRVASILVVVLGHWVVAYVVVEDGVVRTGRLLAVVPATQWLTWIFQVMPIFFFVGGLANAISWDSAKERGETYVDWLRRRARRLLWPLVPLFIVWTPLVLILDALDMPTYMVVLASQVVVLPLWFLAAYFAVVTVSSAAYWLHRRFGIKVIVAFFVLAIIVDVLVRSGVEWVGWANFLWVWGAIHQGGFFWHDRRIPEKPVYGLLLGIVAYGSLLILVYFLNYPLSMIGTGLEERTNDSPPSIALLMLAAGQVGFIFAFRRRAEALLEKTRLWAAVLMTGSRMMTVYLWHMTAMVIVGLALIPTQIWPTPERVDLIWWALRIPWVILLLICLAILVALFGRFEKSKSPEPCASDNWFLRIKTVVSAMLAILGLSLIVRGGLYAGGGLAGLPWIPLLLFVAGLMGLDVLGRWVFRRKRGGDDESEK